MSNPCPECMKKHLLAALAYAESARFPEEMTVLDDSCSAFVSQAWVLASESVAYPSHFHVAVGYVVRAEEMAVQIGYAGADALALDIREVRLFSPTPAELMINLSMTGLCNPFLGHLREAVREGGIKLPGAVSPRWFIDNFYGIIIEAESPEPEERKGGEEVMACAKKAADKGGKAKKENPFAKKAACKGGKCKGKCK